MIEALTQQNFEVELLPWEIPLYQPKKIKALYGGRGSRKSWAISEALLRLSFLKKADILCAREIQDSIEDSVIKLLKDRAVAIGLQKYFELKKKTEIINLVTGSRFFFKGLYNNVDSIKSIPNLAYTWIEEAETISRNTWDTIRPTILRENGSELWVSFNPKKATSVFYKEFVLNEGDYTEEQAYRKKLNYYDNPWFPESLREEMERDKRRDYGKYLHIWEGELLTNSEAQVFKTPTHWVVDKFDVDQNVFKYQGIDFGFSQAPTFAVQCYVKDNTLYVSYEACKKNLDIDYTTDFCEKMIPEFRKWHIFGDSASPILINYIKRQGFAISPVVKGAGSIEDGVEFLKSFDKIVIHERCVNLIHNFVNYSFKEDKKSGVISNNLEDANNDGIDALRYAVEKLMRSKGMNYNKWID